MSNEVVIDPATYRTEEVLRDGGSIHIRAIRPDDRERLLEHFKSLSEQSIYYRFFGIKRTLDRPWCPPSFEVLRSTAAALVRAPHRDQGCGSS